MAAPVAGEANSSLQNPDYQHTSLSDSADDDVTLSQLATPKNSHPNPAPPPSTSSLGKRRKSAPVRYAGFTTMLDKTHSPSQSNSVVQDSSSKSVSSPVMVRAGEIQSSLGNEFPSCIKLMVKAHVDSGYWMGFPQWFGKLFLPQKDSDMMLEDENGEIHSLRYIADKSGLSAGWKKYAVGHNLVEGDALVFHLVEPFKFKVYIVRASDLKEVDGALSLLNLEAHKKQMTPGTDTQPSTTKKNKGSKSLPLTVVQKKHKLSTSVDQSGNDSEEFGSEVLEGSKPSNPDHSSKEFNSFQDFRIMVKGVCIDPELPDDVRMTYYELCNSRNEVLHDALPDNLYHKLVAGLIGETVNIANEIKNCNLTTTKEEFEVWDNSLKSFSLLGMKVGFLRDWIHRLKTLVFESEGRLVIEKYMEAKNKHESIENEVVILTEKLVKLKEASRKLRGTVDDLEQKAGKHEMKFQELVDVPW